MGAEMISSIAALIIALGSLIGLFLQRSGTMADVTSKLFDPMSKRIDDLESDLKKERRARRWLEKKVKCLVNGIKILTGQLETNGIEPEFVLNEDEEFYPDEDEEK